MLVDGPAVVDVEVSPSEVLERPDRHDPVVGYRRTVVSPVTKVDRQLGPVAGGDEGCLIGAEGQTGAVGDPVVVNQMAEHASPPAADVQHPAHRTVRPEVVSGVGGAHPPGVPVELGGLGTIQVVVKLVAGPESAPGARP